MTGVRCRLFVPAAVLTALLSLAACWSDSNAVEQSLGPDLFGEPGRQAVIWTFSSSPIVASIGRIPGHLPEVFGVDAAAAAGLPAWVGIAAQTAGAGLLAWAGVHLLRRRRIAARDLP